MKSKGKHNGIHFICVESSTGLQIIPYKLERSRRIKRMSLQFDSSQFVTLKMPLRKAEHHGTRFILEHGDWICRTLETQPGVPGLREFLLKNSRLSIAGRWHKVELSLSIGPSGFLVDDTSRSIKISLNPREPAEVQLHSVLMAIARTYVTERVRFLAAHHGIRTHGITIRDQKSRWGSCSETGGISLNWRLILIAPKLQDHVILHELAHIHHFDHSSEFHRFLGELDPHTDKHAGKLDDEAMRVMALGREDS
ncbi:MAG: M48 family metallopeptidase [Puniceicoccaceae bacterium]